MGAFDLIILGLMLATLAILIFGIVTMMRGGADQRQRSNKLMFWRVGFQGVIILILGVMFVVGR